MVFAFEAGSYIAITWHLGANVDSLTKVEVWLRGLPDERAKVKLVHTGWEAWEGKADDMRNGYNSGWVFVFEECLDAKGITCLIEWQPALCRNLPLQPYSLNWPQGQTQKLGKANNP